MNTSLAEAICKKYNLDMDRLVKYCINKYKGAKNRIYYINNACQCNIFKYCSICEDDYIWEWDHTDPHVECLLCNHYKMYYIAQKEYAKEEKLQDVFSFHRKYSTAFGGKPKAEYNNVKPIEENINKEF